MRIAPAARRSATPALRSGARFRVRFRDGLHALTGQQGTLVRASTSTALDSHGNTITVGYGRPRREIRAWEGDEPVAGLRLSTDDLTYPCGWAPEQATLLIQCVDLGTRTTANAGLVYVGNDAVTGARLVVDSSGSQYRATLHNGTDDETVTLADGPANGGGAALLVQLDDDGTLQRIRMACRVVGSATSWTAWSATQARASAWGTGPKLRVNRTGSGGTQGSIWLREIAWVPGLLDFGEIEGAL